jgi:hypothetical protein
MAGAGRAALGDQIMGNNHHILHESCRGLSLSPREHTVRRDDGTSVFSVSTMHRTLSGFAKGSAASASIRRIAVAAARGSSGARAKPD